MLELIRIQKKIFYITMVSISIIILAASLNILLRANSDASFNLWLVDNGMEMIDEAEAFQVYLGILMVDYFLRLIVPIVYGLQTFFAYRKSGVGIIYKSIWLVILGAMLVVTLLNFDTAVISDYISSISYIVIVIALLNVKKDSQKDIGG